ncbi:DUF342 domain-containing protein [Pontibacillus marinus]|uniref:Flagellar Assembly Protein A N-terminal region domain-containing protein n=1 Tax=Pontibacillus marinus BH030004 = DSM 16465 TaxID=1385511 RepID=A0A0A5HYB6_9BACI|nr:FapA family protein [Pontibacillus marinus]KGX88612.1 hypothetical protein N783_08260 [Pontibacillus marinus BH030004 = DSM 16465]
MGRIDGFSDFFDVDLSKDKMTASLHLKQEYHLELSFDVQDLKDELYQYQIQSGWDEGSLALIASGLPEEGFPVVVARGELPQKGKDGEVHYVKELSTSLQRDDQEQINFRDVMRIPTVHEGDKLLEIKKPQQGTPGLNVCGEVVQPSPGKPVKLRAGTNVKWSAEDQSMYADINGQISLGEQVIHIYPEYEVTGDIDMSVGNLDFVGTIVIRGNVPSGYTIKAKGDVKVYGLVEGASIIADGSVHISEGVAATHKGGIYAGLDVRAGYLNQANVEAGRDILIENSIVHSQCVAREHIYCQNGNVIGGALSAGLTIEAKDIGNRMNTPTELYFGVNKKVYEKEKALESRKESLTDSLQKLELIGKKLRQKQQQSGTLSGQERVTLLRQRNSYQQSEQELKEIEATLTDLKQAYTELNETYLSVNGTLYTNTDVTFGKYKRKMNQTHKNVKVYYDNGEITVVSQS